MSAATPRGVPPLAAPAQPTVVIVMHARGRRQTHRGTPLGHALHWHVRSVTGFAGGRAEVVGYDAWSQRTAAHRHLGYLPGDFVAYRDLTGQEYLSYLANLRDGVDRALVDLLAKRLDIDLGRRISALSSGNRQKIGLLQAFMHRPDLDVGAGYLAAGSAAMVLLGVEFGLLAAAIGAATGRRTVAIGAASGLAVLGYLLYAFGRILDSVEPWIVLSTFQHALGNNPLVNGLGAGYALAMVAVGVAVLLASLPLFTHRDIAV